ncbi:MAG: DUF3472 domain-containing protein [Tepidisphaeraceae bacterium]
MLRFTLLAAIAIGGLAFAVPGDQPTRAARSVRLSYLAPTAQSGYAAFYNEVVVEKSVPGSYFQVCGFAGGYLGIQEQDAGKKVAIFSVWDQAKGDNPNTVNAADRVEMLYVGDGVHAQRFGGEGTGAKFLRLRLEARHPRAVLRRSVG